MRQGATLQTELKLQVLYSGSEVCGEKSALHLQRFQLLLNPVHPLRCTQYQPPFWPGHMYQPPHSTGFMGQRAAAFFYLNLARCPLHLLLFVSAVALPSRLGTTRGLLVASQVDLKFADASDVVH